MIRPSEVSAAEACHGRTVMLHYGNRIFTIQAILIVSLLMQEMFMEIATPAYQASCRKFNLPAMPEGFVLLDRVLHHLELELRKN